MSSWSRLEAAKSLGATHTFLSKRDGDPKELAANIAQVVKSQGGLDFAIDTTGRWARLCRPSHPSLGGVGG